MEADWLRSRLESGRSIESIAREAGKAPSTVAYWVNKHGLTSQRAPSSHAARGAIAREVLEALHRPRASRSGSMARPPRSQLATVRHWLARYEHRRRRGPCCSPTRRQRGRAGPRRSRRTARSHGVDGVRAPWNRGFRCRQCRIGGGGSPPAASIKETPGRRGRRRVRVCGYDRSVAGAAVPSPRSRRRRRFSLAAGRADALAARPGRGAQVRPAVRELPREVEAGLLLLPRPGLPISVLGQASRQRHRSGVAQRQSIRLLTEGLWVRIPPPELLRSGRPTSSHEAPTGASFSFCGSAPRFGGRLTQTNLHSRSGWCIMPVASCRPN